MSHPWMPESPCGADCLPSPGDLPEAGLYRVIRRLCGAVGLVLLGGVLVVLPMRQRLVSPWFRMLLRTLGIRLVVDGRITAGGALVACNHVSWLDVVALQALCPMRLLAKSEVRSWPVVGPLAGRVGTVYIDRDRLTALPEAVRTIGDALRDGAVIGVFPEGTTWCGRASGPFRPAVFQAAVDAGVPVQPVALRFRTEDGDPTTAPAFVGEETLVGSVLTVVRTRGLVVEASILSAWDARGADRRELARCIQSAVEETTGAVCEHAIPRQRVAA
jgi:1-acyl-sn-glycerol-3-phosphate acyltransferase